MQCAAVRINVLEMMEPPQKNLPSGDPDPLWNRAAIHGYSPGLAGWPPMMRFTFDSPHSACQIQCGILCQI